MQKKLIIFPPQSLVDIIDKLVEEIINEFEIYPEYKTRLENFYLYGSYQFLYEIGYNAGFVERKLLDKYLTFRIRTKEQTKNIPYSVFLEKLIQNGIVKRLQIGVKGEKYSQYSIGEHIGYMLKPVEIALSHKSDSISLSELKKSFKTNDSNHFKKCIQTQIDNFEHIKVDFNLKELVATGFVNSFDIDKQILNIKKLYEIYCGNFSATYTTQKRLYTNLANLKKEYRKFLYYGKVEGGNELFEIDIKSSQPLIVTSMFNQYATTNEQKEEASAIIDIIQDNNFYETIICGIHKWFSKEKAGKDFIDYSLLGLEKKHFDNKYKNALEFLIKNNHFKNEQDARKFAKKIIMWVLNGKRPQRKKCIIDVPFLMDCDNNSTNKKNEIRANEIVSITFPKLFEYLKTFIETPEDKEIIKYLKENKIKNTIVGWDKNYNKAKSLGTLWHILQSKESEIVQSVIQKILKINKNVFFFTIHDSIVTRVIYKDSFKKLLETEILEQTGISVVLEPKKIN